MIQTLNHPKLVFRLSIFFLIAIILGLPPWEAILSIQIRNRLLYIFTSSAFGLFGLIGLLIILWIFIKDVSRLALFIKIASGCLAVPLTFFLCLSIALPSFRWYDTSVYHSNNEYLVIQEQETFVTSAITRQRAIRTKSPYAAIRIIEEQFEIKNNDNQFSGTEILYHGKKWVRELSDNNK